MDINQYYKAVFDNARTTMEQSLQKQEQLAQVHSFAEDLLAWYRILSYREEAIILKNVASELQFSAFSLTCGLYRQSFISLRIVLESSLAAIFFSSYELEFREWQQGKRDIYWSELIGTDDKPGVLSKRWARAFCPELDDESIKKYCILASQTYRKLSEFVHGNAYTWELNQVQLSFNQDAFNNWMKQFSNASKVICFVLCLRFLKNIKQSDINDLKEQLIDCFSDIEAIRKIIGLAN